VLLDPTRLGYTLTAVIFVQAQGGHLEQVEKEIAAECDVAAVYDVTGEYDTAVVAKFKSREDLNSFVKRLAALNYVKKTTTTVSLNIVKEDFRVKLP
jgi:DNA-binding Lrp family transcriptional regulator